MTDVKGNDEEVVYNNTVFTKGDKKFTMHTYVCLCMHICVYI